MDITTFKNLVAAYANRSVASYVVNGVDVLLDAINDVHRVAQRDYNFHRAEGTGFVTANAYGVPMTSSIYSQPQGAGSVMSFKTLTSAWLYVQPGTDPTQVQRIKQIDIVRESDLKNITLWSDEYPMYPSQYPPTYPFTYNPQTPTTLKQRLYIFAGNIFLTGTPPVPNTSPQSLDVMVQGIQKLPDYDAVTNTTDFFLVEYKDWMLLKTLERLNLFSKEDQRVPISAAAMSEAWDSVLRDDESFIESADDLKMLN